MSVTSRNRFRTLSAAAVSVAALIAATACGGSDDAQDSDASTVTTAEAAGTVLRVPADYDTIQAAVDATKPGDLVLIAPGVYTPEGVGIVVETADIVIRGEDRNEVIIDGEFTRDNGIKVFSDGVAIENLTVRNHTANGLFFTGEYNEDTSRNKILAGWRASYITAYNNGLYGIYGFNANDGQIDHSYGSGHPDSAFYVGQCNPCNSVITDSVGEYNMLGYSGTNSTGVTIVNSVFRNNRSGIVPNSLNGEKLAPNAGTTIVGNLIENNNSAEAPSNESFAIAYGTGIVFGGVSNNVAERNLIRGHQVGGVVVTDMPDGFKPEGNVVRANRLSDNRFDLVYIPVNFASTLFGNCFEDNETTANFPENLQEKAGCGGEDFDFGDLSGILAEVPVAPADVDWKTVAAPGPMENMADAATAPAVPATNGPVRIDLDSISVPKG